MIRNYHGHNREREGPAIDLTPLLDITFIVLVFLLLVVNIPLNQMTIELPKVSQTPPAQADTRTTTTLYLFAEQPYWGIEGQRYQEWSEFEQQVEQLAVGGKRGDKIIVVTDRQAYNENLLNMLYLLQRQQIPVTQILTQGAP